MPPDAKIFLAEDDVDIQTLGKIFLEAEGHRVLITATRSDVLNRRVMEAAARQNINVAVVDGSLNRELAQALKDSFPGVKIVNCDNRQSLYSQATVEKGSSRDWLQELAKAVTKI